MEVPDHLVGSPEFLVQKDRRIEDAAHSSDDENNQSRDGKIKRSPELDGPTYCCCGHADNQKARRKRVDLRVEVYELPFERVYSCQEHVVGVD